MEIVKSGDIEYKIINGTAYHKETSDEVVRVLESARNNRTRIKLYYGDVETGRDWHEEYDTVGTVGRSTGSIKVPLLIKTSRSYGGGSILDHAIVKIKDASTGRVLYQHPKYQAPVVEIVKGDLPEYEYNTMIDGKLHGRHKTLRSAEMLKKKLMEDGGKMECGGCTMEAGGKTKVGKTEFGIGIDFQSEFSSSDRDLIEEDIHNHVADMVRRGYTQGELVGEEPDYKGWWNVDIDKDDEDEDVRNDAVADRIRDGYTSGYYPTFTFGANVWKQKSSGGSMDDIDDEEEEDYDYGRPVYGGAFVFDDGGEDGRYTAVFEKTGDIYSISYPHGVSKRLSNVTDRMNITFGYGWRKGRDEKNLEKILKSELGEYLSQARGDKSMAGKEIRNEKDIPDKVKKYISSIKSSGGSMMESGGGVRPASAVARERKYTSGEKHELKYMGNRKSPILQYQKHSSGGSMAKGGGVQDNLLLGIGTVIRMEHFGMEKPFNMTLTEVVPIKETEYFDKTKSGNRSYHFIGSKGRSQYYTENILKKKLDEGSINIVKKFSSGGSMATGGGVKGGYKISYQKHWHPTEGTTYDQTVKIDKRTYDHLRDAVASEIAMGRPQKDKYVWTSGYEFYLKPLVLENGVVYLNHTQTRFINMFLKLPLKDRNTMLKVVDKLSLGGLLDSGDDGIYWLITG